MDKVKLKQNYEIVSHFTLDFQANLIHFIPQKKEFIFYQHLTMKSFLINHMAFQEEVFGFIVIIIAMKEWEFSPVLAMVNLLLVIALEAIAFPGIS